MFDFVTCYFSVSVETDDHVVFVLYPTSEMYYISYVLDVMPAFHSWDKSDLVVMFNPFLCVAGFRLLSILLKIFTSVFLRGY